MAAIRHMAKHRSWGDLRRSAAACALAFAGAVVFAGALALTAVLAVDQAAAQGLGSQADLRGGQPPDPRALSSDPRALPPPNPFEARAARPAPAGAGPLIQEPPAGPATANGGPVNLRPVNRATRPVQGRVRGAAARPVRPLPRAVVGLPTTAVEPPVRLRGVSASTRIVTPAPDGLGAAPARRVTRPEDDPYAPLGLRLGGLTVTPSLTQSLGYDSNPNRSPRAARGSVVSRTEGEIGVRSDWSIHSFTANLRAGYSAFPDQRDANRPDALGTANLRLNVTRDTDIDIDGRLAIDTQRPGSPNLGAVTRDRPLTYAYGASLGVTQRYNRLALNLRGSVDRSTFDNARDSLGATIVQSDRDQVQLGVRARASYELAPGVQPFVEFLADRRSFDQTVDNAGFRRASTGLGGRVGSSFELSRLLTGEIAVGYQQRDFADARLRDLRGLIGEASLIWTPTPLTTVRLRGATDLADTTIANVSGSVNRRGSLEIEHALRRNWTLTAFANLSRNSFDGIALTEDTAQLGLRTEYKLTRSLAVRASFTHERLTSTTPGSDYTANIFLAGLRFQL
jgi:hypothetical protein